MTSSTRFVLTQLEVAAGMVIGGDAAPPLEAPHLIMTPKDALSSAVREGLRRPPCMVSFSGGRDSSALLSLAADLARREGLPLPLPVTARFPGAVDSDESDWQWRTIKHLGISDWQRLTLGDELDVIGPVATAGLLRHGLLYPVNAHLHVPLAEVARGGSLITGAAGDELFTAVQWWGQALALAHDGHLPSARCVLRLAARGAPSAVRARLYGRRHPLDLSWLTIGAARQAESEIDGWFASQPAGFGRSLRQWWWPSRYLQLGMNALEVVAQDFDVRVIRPFADSRVLNALATARSFYGFSSRAGAMDSLFGEFLPPTVVRRESKATFDDVLVNQHSRQFISSWSGDGFDPQMVDASALRRVWSQRHVDIRSLLLLQAAWLAQHVNQTD